MGVLRLALLQLQCMGLMCGRKLARCLMIEAKLRSTSLGPHSNTRSRRHADAQPAGAGTDGRPQQRVGQRPDLTIGRLWPDAF